MQTAERIAAAEAAIGYTFENKSLLAQALGLEGDNLMTLALHGDGILKGVIAGWLAKQILHWEAKKGKLSSHRKVSDVYNRANTNAVAAHVCVHVLSLDQIAGVLNFRKRKKLPKCYADMMEAVIGAIMDDGGYKAARAFVLRVFPLVELVYGKPTTSLKKETPPSIVKEGKLSIESSEDLVALQKWMAEHLPGRILECSCQSTPLPKGKGALWSITLRMGERTEVARHLNLDAGVMHVARMALGNLKKDLERLGYIP